VTDDSTYRFDPAEFREDADTEPRESPGEPGTEADAGTGEGEARRATETGQPGDAPSGGTREFGWRGWVLVGMLFVALVVVPVLLYFVPRVQWLTASLGLGYRDAFLVLPLVPALVLAALAVWATTRP
jgi:hypothetical protein